MIAFECPVCGKHLEFDLEQAGRRERCVECGAPFTVPQPHKNTPVPPPPPPVPVPPPPPPQYHGASVLPFLPLPSPPPSPPPHSGDDVDAEVLSLLGHVYNEAREDFAARRAAGPPPLPTPPKPPEPAQKPKPWGCWFLCGFLIVASGGAAAAWFLIDWKGPNPHLIEARRLKEESAQTLIRAHAREMEWRDRKIEANALWGRTDKSIDAIIAASADVHGKKQELDERERLLPQAASDRSGQADPSLTEARAAFEAARERLSLHHADYLRLREQAARNAADSDEIALEWKELREASDRLLREADAKYLRARSENVPFSASEMDHAPRHAFQMPKLLRDTPLSPRDDQTEGLFTDFQFPDAEEPDVGAFFATFDSSRRVDGETSLRITRLGEAETVVLYPVDGGKIVPKTGNNATARGKANWALTPGDCFVFQLRFPEVDELPGAVRIDERTGTLRRLSLRIGNANGWLRYEATEPRYLDVLFYAGRGGFTLTEIPLAGNAFWKRTESEGLVADAGFFDKIGWLELRFLPDSPLTSIWIDGLRFVSRAHQAEINLQMVELSQESRRARDRLLIERHRDEQQRLRQHGNIGGTKESRPAVQTPNGPGSPARPAAEPSDVSHAGKTPEQHRIASRVLELGGSVEAVVDGRLRQFQRGADIPVLDFERLVGVRLADCPKLTEADLDLLGTVRELQTLDLARTGLNDAALIKLSTLNRLESLDLSGNDITFDGLPNLVGVRETLQSLRLDGCRWGRLRLEPVGKFTQLRLLSLENTPIDDADLGYLFTLGKLETLSLAETRVSDRAFPLLGPLTALRELNLRGTVITEAAIAEAHKTLPKVKIMRSD